MKPKQKVKIVWSSSLAYAVGLITTDGNLSPDGRHINLTSKDIELILTFKKCLNLKNRIGKKARGGSKEQKYYVIQFGDVVFYKFLVGIGLSEAKSKTLEQLEIPSSYFFDFLRGCLDGDGNINISAHPESKESQLRVRFASASTDFLLYLLHTIRKKLRISGGYIYSQAGKSVSTLSFGKKDGIKLLRSLYHSRNVPYLKRKYLQAKMYLGE